MNFDQWCASKQIKGNYRESLYHHIMATRGDVGSNQDMWRVAWRELLDEIVKNIPKGE